jgi:hypothetical protein
MDKKIIIGVVSAGILIVGGSIGVIYGVMKKMASKKTVTDKKLAVKEININRKRLIDLINEKSFRNMGIKKRQDAANKAFLNADKAMHKADKVIREANKAIDEAMLAAAELNDYESGLNLKEKSSKSGKVA